MPLAPPLLLLREMKYACLFGQGVRKGVQALEDERLIVRCGAVHGERGVGQVQDRTESFGGQNGFRVFEPHDDVLGGVGLGRWLVDWGEIGDDLMMFNKAEQGALPQGQDDSVGLSLQLVDGYQSHELAPYYVYLA